MSSHHISSIDRALEVKARSWAQSRMSAERFRHTQGVVETVTGLATAYRLETVAALRLAGWVHDVAKEQGDAALLTLAARFGYAIRPVERQFPFLLHGVVAARLARDELGLTDPIIMTAVEYHTTGHPDMSVSDKVFYLADLIEPSRTYHWIDQVRRLVQEDLDKALLFAVTRQIRRLLKHGLAVDPRSVDLRNRLLAAGVTLPPPEAE